MQQKLNERLVALATLQNIPICVTNEVRYLNKDEAFTLDLLQASAKGMMLDLEHQVQTDQLYLKSSFEMESLFDKKYIENIPAPQLYRNFQEQSYKIDEELSEEYIIDVM